MSMQASTYLGLTSMPFGVSVVLWQSCLLSTQLIKETVLFELLYKHILALDPLKMFSTYAMINKQAQIFILR